MLATGAMNAMKNCHKSTSYRSMLKNYNKTFPNPNVYQIKVDLPRTFPDEEFFRNSNIIKSLENVLIAYTIRNPTIGYCQGFNFIVGRLL